MIQTPTPNAVTNNSKNGPHTSLQMIQQRLHNSPQMIQTQTPVLRYKWFKHRPPFFVTNDSNTDPVLRYKWFKHRPPFFVTNDSNTDPVLRDNCFKQRPHTPSEINVNSRILTRMWSLLGLSQVDNVRAINQQTADHTKKHCWKSRIDINLRKHHESKICLVIVTKIFF